MSNILKPMLAGKALMPLNFPLLASPKIDGIRCLVKDGVALSRSLKPIPNEYIQAKIKEAQIDGIDGELGVGFPGGKDFYRDSVSAVMRESGEPDFTFYAFDVFNKPEVVYKQRYQQILLTFKDEQPWLKILPQTPIHTLEELQDYEAHQLEMGFEGVMLRDPNSYYKHGRSSSKEGILLKLKRYLDSEAEIIGFQEKLKNGNEEFTNELGRTARSSHQENMIPQDTLGALNVRDLVTKVEFDVGTGFDDATRKDIWNNRKKLLGTIIKYKYFPMGSKDKPRFPVYIGPRDPIDMSN